MITRIVNNIEDGLLAEKEDMTNKSIATLKLPYKGVEGEKLKRSLNKVLLKFSPNNTVSRISYNGTKLGSKFIVKNSTKPEHQHNLIYKITCPDTNCRETYVGETARRLSERVNEHSKLDGKTHVSQHAANSGHKPPEINNFDILTTVNGSTKHRKILEALYIKNHRPTLNIQGASVPLTLF